ncbi:MAG: peptidoglycan DD-metalloendopeptidase family protein [bacterium]|nr:peptidoglycan DD-metalloendopeptidase family protein [bacterium]MCM1376321.1 peptidoglycan DD-metalloendopeptidase family protein [Muribaculum sp.]
MRKSDRKQNIKKERIIMIASSAFVMAALTMTGVYMKENSVQNQDNGYSIDFTEMENQANDKYQEIRDAGQSQLPQPSVTAPQGGTTVQDIPDDDLDYLPMEEAGSNLIEIPGLTDGISREADVSSDEQLAMMEQQRVQQEKTQTDEQKGSAPTASPAQEETAGEQEAIPETVPEQPQEPAPEEQPVGRKLGFSSEQGLIRPVAGEVLIPYSMDHTVYFTTLDHYKYNPATIYQVAEGTQVVACAEAQVAAVFNDREIGQAVTLDLGNGYQVVYGQLQGLSVAEGDYVMPGQIIGTVAAPTIYYSLEGSNLYFLLEQDGAALDPQSMYH